MGDTIIELKGVSKRFDDYDALTDVSLTVSEGALLTLLGPSGCGKTTCLRLIAGITTPDAGEIWLNGRLVASPSGSLPPEQRRVGMVFQDYALFPHLNVADNIAFGLRTSRVEKRARVQELLALVGLQGLEQQMPHLLSGGQQQRVALARALAPEPDILLLDEPFSNLDAALRVQVRGEVRDILRRTRKTAVFVTHDREEALSLSDRVAVLFDGRVHQVGTPEQIYNQPVSAQVAAFVGEANFIHAEASGSRAASPLGELTLIKPARGPVRVLVRPERVHLDTSGEGVLGVVEWREYYGSRQRIGVRLGDGSAIVASTDTQINFEQGDRVKVSVFGPLLAFSAVESAVLLPR